MTVVHLSAEYIPFARTGGLAEAANGLAKFQALAGQPTKVLLPLYRSARERAGALEEVGEPFPVELAGRTEPARLHRQRESRERVAVWFLEHDGYFDRAGIYGEGGQDYPDNLERWAFFAAAAIRALPRLVGGPTLLHAHDWHTALALAHLRVQERDYPWYRTVRTVLSVHNAGYQGQYPAWQYPVLGLPPALFNWRQLEWHGQLNLLKAGLVFADAVVTVSPNHARELRTATGGFGLHGVFGWLGPRFSGILNGIDQQDWDPWADRHLETRYSRADPGPKVACKQAAQRVFGLVQNPAAPLFGMAARLVKQKGLDIILHGEDLLGLDAQFVFLGAGEARYQGALERLAAASPGRIAVNTGFTDELEHQLMAGADLLLMPCEYEPCGLTQMQAMRYGTLPVVTAVGGLVDTVPDVDADPRTGRGFVARRVDPLDLLAALFRATRRISDRRRRLTLQRRVMAVDWSWRQPTADYLALYADLA